MSASRIPPIPPNKGGNIEKSNPTEHRKIEKVEKISKISEVDDESRARNFKQFLEAKEEPEEESESLPSPYTLFTSVQEFSSVKSPTLAPRPSPHPAEDLAKSMEETLVPSPPQTPSPATRLYNTAPIEEESVSRLPQSNEFWEGVDTSASAKSPLPLHMEETPHSAGRSFANKRSAKESKGEKMKEHPLAPSQQKGSANDKKEKESVFGLPGKSLQSTHLSAQEKNKNSQKHEKQIEKNQAPLTAPLQKGPSLSQSKQKGAQGPEGIVTPRTQEGPKWVGPLNPQDEKHFLSSPEYKGKIKNESSDLEETITPGSVRASQQEEKIARGRLFYEKTAADKKEEISILSTRNLEERQEKEDSGERKKEKKTSWEDASAAQITPVTNTPLPEFAIPAAAQAASAAQPYLGAEALAIYFHMVGTITAMVSPKGDALTEFILDAPSFAASKFYGAKISIERFATAPYRLNIRLTGSNEAVSLFNQNIPNLLAAFQNGKFGYTIHRIEASYEKPLFHRKESAREKSKDSQSGKQGQK